MVPPSASRRGRASSKPAGVPPAMMASFASRAPSTPPLTGQSRNSTPRGSRSAAAWRAVSAPMVEQSSISAPDLNPGARARVTSSTSASADTHETTASTPAASWHRAAAESARGGLGRIHLRLGDRFRLDGLGFGYRLLRCVLRHAAAPVLHVLARLLAISVGCSVRKIFALAALVLLEHAAGLDRPHVALLGVLAQDFARLGDILLHRSRVGLIAELRGDAVVPCPEALLLRGA